MRVVGKVDMRLRDVVVQHDLRQGRDVVVLRDAGIGQAKIDEMPISPFRTILYRHYSMDPRLGWRRM